VTTERDPLENITYKGNALSELWERARQYVEMSDDYHHEIWTGPLNQAAPYLKYRGKPYGVRQIAWRVHHVTADAPQRIYHDSAADCGNDMCLTHLSTSRESKSFTSDEIVWVGEMQLRLGGLKQKLKRGSRQMGDCLLFPTYVVAASKADGSKTSVSTRKLSYALTADDPTDIPWSLVPKCGQSTCINPDHLVDRNSGDTDAAEAEDVEEAIETFQLPNDVRAVFASTWEKHQGDIVRFREYVADLATWAITDEYPR
jgi:hypothetical protein